MKHIILSNGKKLHKFVATKVYMEKKGRNEMKEAQKTIHNQGIE